MNGDVSTVIHGSGIDVMDLGQRFSDLYEKEFLESLRSLGSDLELCLDERDAIEILLNILQVNTFICKKFIITLHFYANATNAKKFKNTVTVLKKQWFYNLFHFC